ncbi:NERD domain-containing protein (plasmid) [Nocardia sp. CA-084685]|uniref:nuclease-related domain-containing protein n=1 Tax=Nocardia sp. CA-084685 TaxID=3239970 RepID=UPI003D97846B
MGDLLIINGDRKLDRPERQIISWLHRLSDSHMVSGVAISGCRVPGEVDLLMFTPEGCVVIEAKGPSWEANGRLICLTNGQWYFEDAPDEPALKTSGNMNPLMQVTRNLYQVKDIITAAVGEDMRLNGLVIVVPGPGATITLEKPSFLADGFDVLLGTGPESLHTYLRNMPRRASDSWDADTVLTILRRLEVGNVVTRDDLLARGFPAQPPLTQTTYAPVQPNAVDAAPARTPATRPVENLPVLAPSRLPAVRDVEPAAEASQLHTAIRFAATAIGAALITGLGWAVLQQSANQAPAGGPHPTSGQLAPAPQQQPTWEPPVTVAPAPSAPPPVTKRPAPPACYPFDPAC